MMTNDVTVKAATNWLVSNVSSLALLGTALWFLVAPSMTNAITKEFSEQAPGFIRECFDKDDFSVINGSNSLKGKCAEIVEIVVAGQVESRFTQLETEVMDLKASVAGAATIAKQNQIALDKLIEHQKESDKARTKDIQKILDALPKDRE